MNPIVNLLETLDLLKCSYSTKIWEAWVDGLEAEVTQLGGFTYNSLLKFFMILYGVECGVDSNTARKI